MGNASATASVIVALAISSVGASVFADTVYDFEGTCSDGCTGTATGELVLKDSYTPGTALQREDFVSFTYTSGETTVTYDSFPSPDTSPGGPFQGILPTLSGPSVEWVEIDGPSSGTGLNACGVPGIPSDFFCPTQDFWSFEWRPVGIIRDLGPSHTWTLRDAVVTVPQGLNPGDEYRLVFITLDQTTALPSDIDFYNNFVTDQANTSPELVALGTSWHVVGSTSSVSAKENTNTDDSPAGVDGVPIYRLDGAIVADNYDDLWDGSIQNPIEVAQDGTDSPLFSVWTGTTMFGNIAGVAGRWALGGIVDPTAITTVVDGNPTVTVSSWIETSPASAERFQSLYAISDILTVEGGPQPVSIDIKPGSDPNCFNINGHGVIPVAILGEATLDVTTIDVDSLLFGGLQVRQRKGRALCSVEDVNDDAHWDLVCKFDDVLEDWVADEDTATLTGQLYDGTSIEDTDSICLVPKKDRRRR